MNKAHEKLVAYIKAHPEETYFLHRTHAWDYNPNNHPNLPTSETATTWR